MKRSISPAIVFAAIAALLCVTCNDNGTSPDNNGAVEAFAGKFNRKPSGQTTPPAVPNAPANVKGLDATSNSITISWPSVNGAIGYKVYRLITNSSGRDSLFLLGSTSSTSYTDNGLSAGTTYCYNVSAYNSDGRESSRSSGVCVTTKNDTVVPAPTAPTAPSNVTASASSSSSITVSWSSVSNATGYYVYRSASSSGTYSQIGSASSTSYTDNGLSANTTYYYKVSAYNDAGESTQSFYASATTNIVVTQPVITTFFDTRDHKTYKQVTIGSQTWMAENLNYDTADGTSSWCYGNKPDSCTKYGRLYNWNTAMAGSTSSTANPSGIRGVCPSGWHLPSSAEWGALVSYVGSPAGTKLKSSDYWNYRYTVDTGTDEFGFSGLPGGNYYSRAFNSAGDYGYWWTATENNDANAYRRNMNHNSRDVEEYEGSKNGGFSVRCVKD